MHLLERLLPLEQSVAVGHRAQPDLVRGALDSLLEHLPLVVATGIADAKAQQEAIEKFTQSAGLKPDELIAPPKPAETASQSYCPRCGAQFVVHAGSCADCGGRPVQPFGSIEALKG